MPRNLLTHPLFRADHLGACIPDDLHAVSACLPLWEHNIGYEEGDPFVLEKLQAAYPRFRFHPIVQKLCDELLNEENRRGLPFASARCANRAVEYVRNAGAGQTKLVPLGENSACGVVVAKKDFPLLKQYWQHAGENVSSRVAERILAGTPALATETEARTSVRKRVADVNDTVSPNVLLFPSGMAAIACAWRAVSAIRPGRTCQFGFPYVDTLKIQQRFPAASCEFLPIGNDADIVRLEQLCQTSPPVSIFCEVPTNPLLETPDLQRLRRIADQYDILLVVDDTLAACGNLQLLRYADLLVTSLTKYFSGYGNVLAGSLVVNPHAKHSETLRRAIKDDFEETLSDPDVEVLAANCQDLTERTAKINNNTQQVVEYLLNHPAVASVFHPSIADSNYNSLKSAAGGYGGLLSIVLNDARNSTPNVFDALEICKGPNLGTHFTLCCPYTLLAHYEELDFAESCGVSRWLLRISIGVEPVEDLISRFDRALAHGTCSTT
ncbi:MAG: PLP-dependent transferase [Fuerstiella sp.]